MHVDLSIESSAPCTVGLRTSRQTVRPLAVGAVLALAIGSTAQIPGLPPVAPTTPTDEAGSPGAQETEPPLVRQSERKHSRTRSLSLFAGIDLDSDDRLDVAEFQRGFGVESKRAERFRELDPNRDGWIDWSEFDLYFRDQIDRRAEFTVFTTRTVYELRDPAEAELQIDPRRLIVRSIDSNEDELVQYSEFGRFLRDVRLPKTLGEQFSALDIDGSGALNLDEFGAVAMNVPGVIEKVKNTKDPRSSLPIEDRAADNNLDGVLDAEELAESLRAIHPSLARHAPRVLQDADGYNDRRLGGPELFQARQRARAWLMNQLD